MGTIRIDNVLFDDKKEDDKFEDKVDFVCKRLKEVHGSNFVEDLMRETVCSMLKCQFEVDEYDRMIIEIVEKDGPLEVPPKLQLLRKEQATRLATLMNQLDIPVSRVRKGKNRPTGNAEAEAETSPVFIAHR